MSLNLYPSEEKAIQAIISEEIRLLRLNQNKLTSYERFRDAIQDRLHKIGFLSVVSIDQLDPKNYDLLDDDTLVFSPQVDILSRIDKNHEIDFDKMQFEEKKKVGYEIKPDGTKKEV